MPCFNDKQWILITANLQSGKFFDIMNPDGSGQDRFTTIISTVCYNFKSLFALTYPNCNAFSIKDFDYRFVAVPRTHFRLTSFVLMSLTNFPTIQANRDQIIFQVMYSFFLTLDLNLTCQINCLHHCRYDTGVFLLQILKTYRGMGVPGFSTVRVSYF